MRHIRVAGTARNGKFSLNVIATNGPYTTENTLNIALQVLRGGSIRGGSLIWNEGRWNEKNWHRSDIFTKGDMGLRHDDERWNEERWA